MEKKTGRSRKAVQSLKPKKLVYWAVAIPAFLALLLFAIVFLDHSDNDISRAMASKAMALSFATGTTSLRRRENTEAILERRIRMNGMPNILTI